MIFLREISISYNHPIDIEDALAFLAEVTVDAQVEKDTTYAQRQKLFCTNTVSQACIVHHNTAHRVPYSILLGVLELALHEIVGKLLTVKVLKGIVFYTKKRCHSSPS